MLIKIDFYLEFSRKYPPRCCPSDRCVSGCNRNTFLCPLQLIRVVLPIPTKREKVKTVLIKKNTLHHSCPNKHVGTAISKSKTLFSVVKYRIKSIGK